MMDIVENSKQFEFLMTIKNVGMQIIYRKANGFTILNEFSRFDGYIEDDDKRLAFIKSLEELYDAVNANLCTPDKLLFELGQYTPYIIYDDADDPEQTELFDDDDNWLYS